VWSSVSVAQTPKIRCILKMLRIRGFSKPQAEHVILRCLKRVIAAINQDISNRVKAVRISEVRLVTQPGYKQRDKMFQTPEHIPWEEGSIVTHLDGRDAADALLRCCSPSTISICEELTLPTLAAELVFSRRLEQNELDALMAEEIRRVDALILESVAKSQPCKQLHRVPARLEFTLKRKQFMPETVLKKAVIDALGGPMRGIEGVLFPKNRHGKVDLRGRGDTCIWVSDLVEAGSKSRYGERLDTALSTCGETILIGECFSCIRVKSGSPSMVQVVAVTDTKPLSLNEVMLSIEKYLFNASPAFLPATFDGNLGQSGLKDDDECLPGCIRVDARDICTDA
jgi:hypothetical protein